MSRPTNRGSVARFAYLAVNRRIDVQNKKHRNDGEQHDPFAEKVELKTGTLTINRKRRGEANGDSLASSTSSDACP